MTGFEPLLSTKLIGSLPLEERVCGSESRRGSSASGAGFDTRRLSPRAWTRPTTRRKPTLGRDGLHPSSDDRPLLASLVTSPIVGPGISSGGVPPLGGRGKAVAEAPKV